MSTKFLMKGKIDTLYDPINQWLETIYVHVVMLRDYIDRFKEMQLG